MSSARELDPPPTPAPGGDSNAYDEEIYCPLCNYNLTGVYSGRCPECGGVFHRESLIAAQQTNQITVMPWDDPERMSIFRRFGRTLAICLFNARRFAFAFSVQPQRTRAASFKLIVMLIAWLMAAVPVLVGAELVRTSGSTVFLGKPGDVLGIGLITVGLLFVAANVLTLLSALVLWLLCPHYDGRLHYGPWYAIAAYAAAHWGFVGLGLPLFFLFVRWSGGEPTLALMAMYSVMLLGCGWLQVATISGVVKLRTAPTASRRLALLILTLLYGVFALLAPVLSGLAAAVIWSIS